MESRPLSINISSIHISGVGGLGMVAMVVVMALAIPLAAAVLVGSALGGALAAAIVIRRRNEHVIGTPGDDMPMRLGLRDTDDRPLDGLALRDGGRGLAPRLAISY